MALSTARSTFEVLTFSSESLVEGFDMLNSDALV